MTYYDYLTRQSEKFTRYAINSTDSYLKTFYSKAARGYIMRRDQLTLEEAMQEHAFR